MIKKLIYWILILAGLLILTAVISLCIGSAGILLFSGGKGVEHSILFSIRLPRIILAIIVGGAKVDIKIGLLKKIRIKI